MKRTINKNTIMPFQKYTIAFDLEGTLIKTINQQDAKIMQSFLKLLKRRRHVIWVWSENNIRVIEKSLEKLGLTNFVDAYFTKQDFKLLSPDIIFGTDPMSVLIGEKIFLI